MLRLRMATKMYIQLMLHPNDFYTPCIVGFLSADMAPVAYKLSNLTILWVLSVLIKSYAVMNKNDVFSSFLGSPYVTVFHIHKMQP